MTTSAASPSPPSPKQKQGHRSRDWYPYYAGFSAAFAENVISHSLGSPSSLLDPWNGSGTTTACAAASGIAARGVDLNPAMTIIALGRLAPLSAADELTRLAPKIAEGAIRRSPRIAEDDPLLIWFRHPAAAGLRSIGAEIERCTGVAPGSWQVSAPAARRRKMLESAFLTTALMATTRELLSRFRRSNPTWLSSPGTPQHRISPSGPTIQTTFEKYVHLLAGRLVVSSTGRSRSIRLTTGTVLELPGDGRWDACLTSPPYATRVDYVKASAPELAVAGVSAADQEALRRRMMGTPLVRGRSPENAEIRLGDSASSVLDQVGEHASHGSANYYLPWLRAYFAELRQGVARIGDAIREGGRIAIVVQDSYYKDVHLDLQAIIVDFMSAEGRTLAEREDFAAKHLMSNVNTRAKSHKSERTNTESLLVFQ